MKLDRFLKSARSIEFIGLPGAGKTTYAHRLKVEMVRNGWEVFNSRELFLNKVCDILDLSRFDRLKFSLELTTRSRLSKFTNHLKRCLFDDFYANNQNYVDLCQFMIDRLPAHDASKTYLKDWLYEEGAYYSLFKNIKNDNVLLLNDEGFFHRSLVYFSHSHVNLEFLESYASLVPSHDCLLAVNTSTSVSLDRLRSRGDYVYEMLNKQSFGEIELLFERFSSIRDHMVLSYMKRMDSYCFSIFDESDFEIFLTKARSLKP